MRTVRINICTKTNPIQYKFYTHRFLSKCPAYLMLYALHCFISCMRFAMLFWYSNKLDFDTDWLDFEEVLIHFRFYFHHFIDTFNHSSSCFVYTIQTHASIYKFDITSHSFMMYIEWMDREYKREHKWSDMSFLFGMMKQKWIWYFP